MIKTWEERCVEHPDHQTGMVSYAMIQARMQEEIDELRAAVFDPDWDRVKERKPLTDQEIIEAIKHISHNEMSAFAIARAIEKVLK